MRISYNKLWKMLIDKEMNKNDLKDAAGISAASVAKLGKGANITTDVLLKICEALDLQDNNKIEGMILDLCFCLLRGSQRANANELESYLKRIISGDLTKIKK